MTTRIRARRRRCSARALFGSVLALSVVVGVSGLAGAAGSGPFAGIAEPGTVPAPTYVGTDGSGNSVALTLTGGDAAVAYVCDGTGKTGVWLTGSIDSSGVANLESKDGTSTLTYDLAAGTGEVTIGGTSSPISLERATGIAGLYRDTIKGKGKTLTLGWILHDDGLLVGGGAVGSKPTVGASTDVGAPPPSTGSGDGTVASDGGPVPFVFAKGLRCAIADFRGGFNKQQGADAAAAGDAAGVADAAADREKIIKKRDQLGCIGSGAAQAT